MKRNPSPQPPPPPPPPSPPPPALPQHEECFLLNTKVVSLTRRTNDNSNDSSDVTSSDSPGDDGDGSPPLRLQLGDGSEILAYAAVVATEAPAAARLLGESALDGGALPKEGRSSTCLYFAIDGPAPVRFCFFLDFSFLMIKSEVSFCSNVFFFFAL